jgi:hypothetical protein
MSNLQEEIFSAFDGEKSGYHFFMDRLRSGGNLHFWCGCGRSTKVELEMPLTMRCFCDRLLIVVDKQDLP